MNTLGWVDNSGSELFYLGWYESGAGPQPQPIFDENYYRVYRIPRETLAVMVNRLDTIIPANVIMRTYSDDFDMGKLIEVARDQTTVGVGTQGYSADVVFPRGGFTNMQLRIKSSEELGILDSDYIEDYDGLDGYVTLRRLLDDSRVSYPAIPLPGETPGIDNDVFQITVPLASVNNEVYALEGRVRDVIGNFTIFGAVATPIGGEDVTSLTIEIVDGFSVQYVYEAESISVRPAIEVVLVERGK